MSDTAMVPAGGDDGGGALANRDERRKALAQLPDGYRRPVAFFYAMYSDMLRSPVGLATTLKYWIARHDLTEADVRAVLNRLAAPERRKGIEYASQLMAAMAAEVCEQVARRKSIEAQLAARGKATATDAERPTVGRMAREHLATFGRMD